MEGLNSKNKNIKADRSLELLVLWNWPQVVQWVKEHRFPVQSAWKTSMFFHRIKGLREIETIERDRVKKREVWVKEKKWEREENKLLVRHDTPQSTGEGNRSSVLSLIKTYQNHNTINNGNNTEDLSYLS